ncbi:MAG: hypothetical protein ACRD5I_12925, partial [Candidatus Acidiferrales bacterium]
ADDCIALDQRIQGLLKQVGAKIPTRFDKAYDQIETELIQHVAKPLGMSGAVLDSILFQNFGAIRADLRLMKTSG